MQPPVRALIDSLVRGFLFLLLLWLVPAPLLAARLTGLAAVPGTVTVIADGPPAVAHQFALTGPYRLVIDLPAVVPAPLAVPGAGSVTQIRAAMFAPGVARLVLDLSGPLAIVSARSSATGLTISLRRVSEAEFAEQVKAGRKPLPVQTGGPDTGDAAKAAAGTRRRGGLQPAQGHVRAAGDAVTIAAAHAGR